jgi:HAD superfamily hydrolase (TIGR01509 family)
MKFSPFGGEGAEIRAVLWDLDGTLADTAELHFHAWQTTLARHGVHYSQDDFQRDFGRANPELLADLFPATPVADLLHIGEEKERDFQSSISGRVNLLPGVWDWLTAFQAAGIPQIVCSSGPTANIAALLVETGIADCFAGLLSGVHVPRGKPAPDLFLRGAAALGVDPIHCLVIEDSRHGVEGAANAGMHCVVVGPLTGQAGELAGRFSPSTHLWPIPRLDGVGL